MSRSRLPWLMLATSLLLSACGSGTDDSVQTQQSLQVSSSSRAFSVSAPATTTVMRGLRENFAIARTDTGYSVTDLRSGTLTNVSVGARLRFDDTSTALDLDGIPGQAYRLYRAAFGRIPDLAGLSYWITVMDAGTRFETVARGFVDAQEFKAVYGAKPANLELVSRMYLHVLGRQGEPAGIEYWTGLLDKKLITTAEVLVGFSESAESKAASLASARQGIAYHEPGYFYGVLAANEFRIRTGVSPITAADARTRWNEQGALGYAYSRRIRWESNVRPNWEFDVYAVSQPRAKYTYEVREASSRWPERAAMFEELGAKGYRYKMNRQFPTNYGPWYDVFVKNSEVDTTYRYQFELANYTFKTLNERGAQGYAYLDVLANANYVVYAKDMKSDAVFEYVQAESKKFGDGGVEQLNDMGGRSFAFVGYAARNVGDPTKSAYLFVRSSAYSGTFSYFTEPAIYLSAQEASDAVIRHGLQGKTYQGNNFHPYSYAQFETLYSKGGPIDRPHLGQIMN